MKRLIYVKTLLNFNRDKSRYLIEKFMKSSLDSMIKQTNQDFVARVIYEDKSEKGIMRILNEYKGLPQNIKFISRKKSYKDLYDLIKDYEEFYSVRWDIGDIYNRKFIQKISEYRNRDNVSAIINKEGFFYDQKKGRKIKVSHGKECVTVHINNVDEYLNLSMI